MDVFLRPAVVGQTHALIVNGEIDLATVPELRNALVKLVGAHPAATVAVDLDGVTACDDVRVWRLTGSGGARS